MSDPSDDELVESAALPIVTLPKWAPYLDDIARLLPLPFASPNGKRLLAMGDSWFNYLPHYDAMWWLHAKYGFACNSVALIGDKLTHMARPDPWDPRNPKKLGSDDPGHQLADLAIMLRDDLDDDQRKAVSAVLVSGGGNDIAGKRDDLEALLNDAGSSSSINDQAFKAMVEVRLRSVLVDVLSAVTELSSIYLQRVVPIYIHGYGWPVPDGRPGPVKNWLRPAFEFRHYTDLQQCTDIMKCLIDRFNAMQLDVIKQTTGNAAFAPVHHVDLRPVLSNIVSADAYKADWQNELHPTIPRGFEKVADVFARVL